jgi:hypothetical protein
VICKRTAYGTWQPVQVVTTTYIYGQIIADAEEPKIDYKRVPAKSEQGYNCVLFEGDNKLLGFATDQVKGQYRDDLALTNIARTSVIRETHTYGYGTPSLLPAASGRPKLRCENSTHVFMLCTDGRIRAFRKSDWELVWVHDGELLYPRVQNYASWYSTTSLQTETGYVFYNPRLTMGLDCNESTVFIFYASPYYSMDWYEGRYGTRKSLWQRSDTYNGTSQFSKIDHIIQHNLPYTESRIAHWENNQTFIHRVNATTGAEIPGSVFLGNEQHNTELQAEADQVKYFPRKGYFMTPRIWESSGRIVALRGKVYSLNISSTRYLHWQGVDHSIVDSAQQTRVIQLISVDDDLSYSSDTTIVDAINQNMHIDYQYERANSTIGTLITHGLSPVLFNVNKSLPDSSPDFRMLTDYLYVSEFGKRIATAGYIVNGNYLMTSQVGLIKAGQHLILWARLSVPYEKWWSVKDFTQNYYDSVRRKSFTTHRRNYAHDDRPPGLPDANLIPDNNINQTAIPQTIVWVANLDDGRVCRLFNHGNSYFSGIPTQADYNSETGKLHVSIAPSEPGDPAEYIAQYTPNWGGTASSEWTVTPNTEGLSADATTAIISRGNGVYFSKSHFRK